MTFAQLQIGDAVFLDANTFIYHFTPDPLLGPPCSQLLQRIENQEVTGFTSFHVAAEVAHKMMTVEASAVLGWPFAGMANRLRRHPVEVQRLVLFRQVLERLDKSRVRVLENSLSDLLAAAPICQQAGLLINDALIVALMQANSLTTPATMLTSTGCRELSATRPRDRRPIISSARSSGC
jgi:predicted nucleic acid-binding protein